VEVTDAAVVGPTNAGQTIVVRLSRTVKSHLIQSSGRILTEI